MQISTNFQIAIDEVVLNLKEAIKSGEVVSETDIVDIITNCIFKMNIKADDIFLFESTVKEEINEFTSNRRCSWKVK